MVLRYVMVKWNSHHRNIIIGMSCAIIYSPRICLLDLHLSFIMFLIADPCLWYFLTVARLAQSKERLTAEKGDLGCDFRGRTITQGLEITEK